MYYFLFSSLIAATILGLLAFGVARIRLWQLDSDTGLRLEIMLNPIKHDEWKLWKKRTVRFWKRFLLGAVVIFVSTFATAVCLAF